MRIYPDHTLLLREGEAFLAHEDAGDAKEVLAMRSPSYFKGDLRRLKLVNMYTLVERAQSFQEPPDMPELLRRTPEQRVAFFLNVKNALILSVRGHRSEADRMSGGDYDGDLAWTCWNSHLLEHVICIEAEDTSKYQTMKSTQETRVFWETTLKEQFEYFLHFQGHQQHLGKLAESLDKCIDKYGFQHEFSRELGKAAFQQVIMTSTMVSSQGFRNDISNSSSLLSRLG